MGNEHHSINICCSKNDWILQHKLLYLHGIHQQIQNKSIFHKPNGLHFSTVHEFDLDAAPPCNHTVCPCSPEQQQPAASRRSSPQFASSQWGSSAVHLGHTITGLPARRSTPRRLHACISRLQLRHLRLAVRRTPCRSARTRAAPSGPWPARPPPPCIHA